jgi:hypothetical protein
MEARLCPPWTRADGEPVRPSGEPLASGEDRGRVATDAIVGGDAQVRRKPRRGMVRGRSGVLMLIPLDVAHHSDLKSPG